MRRGNDGAMHDTRDRRRHAAILTAATCALAFALPCRAADLASDVRSLVADYEAENKGRAAVSVVDLASGCSSVDFRSDRLSIPASNQKLLTSAFILARFGPGYEFTTSVYQRGDDLVVVGGHDPLLGDPKIARRTDTSIYAELDRWAEAVKDATGGKLAGDILLAGPAERESRRHPDWPEDQHNRDYAAPVGALNYHNNCIEVSFESDGRTARPVLSPRSRHIRVKSTVRPGKRNVWSMRTNEDDSLVTLGGTMTGEKTWPLAVPVDRPALLLGRVLADRLAEAGVDFDGDVRAVPPLEADDDEMKLILATRTPLSAVLRRTNKDSVNMAAEAMLLAAGDGTWVGSAEIMERTLGEAFGIEEDDLRVADGSGLSRNNRVTPRATTTVLYHLSGGRAGELLLEGLPTSGVDGTLRKRLRGPGCKGRVKAKTGYIRGVSCLSGYVLDEKGGPAYAFSVMVNQVAPGKAWKAKQLQDAICRAVLRHHARAGDPEPLP